MATAGTGSDAPESARARRARIKAEREAALAAAIARGLTPEQAQRAVDEEARAEARARAWDGRPSVPAAEAGGIPSLRAPEPLRAPAVAAPPSREPGPSEGTIGRFLSPSKVPGRIGNLLYLAALANIAAAIVRPWRNRMPEVATYLPGAVEGYVVAFAILSGLFLLLVARAVKRGKARGWWAAVILLSLLLVFDVAEGELPRRPIATTLTVLALALLLVFRRQFAAASDPTTRWRALWVFLGLLVSSLLAGAAFVRVESRHLFEVRNLGWTDALIAAATGMLGQDLNDLAVTPTPRLQVISNVLIVLGLVTVLVPVWLFLRSPRQVGTIDADDDRRMRLSKAPGVGVRRVSLNFAMFRSTFERGEKLGAGPILKAWRRLLQVGNRWFQLESLYRFNAKFRPVWYPRFVIYPRAVDIVRVGLAAGRAEAFIVFPRLTLPFRGGR